MSEIEKIQDRIDEYIRGTMSASDRIIFEGELRHNAELRHEVEVQASIAEAVQAVRLKQLLQEVEAGMAGVPAKEEPKSKVFFLFRRQVLTWASAAAAVAIIFFSGNSWRQAQRFKGFGNEYYAAFVEPVARDGNELDNLLSSSYALIGSGEYEAAMANLSDAKKIIDDGLGLPTVDEESEYEHKVLQEKLYDVDWYEAIILMKQGKYRKAKDALRTIAASESTYAENAKNILE